MRPPSEYFDVLSFDVAEFLNGFRPDYEAPSTTEQDYLEALADLGEGGPEALTEAQLEMVLAVSWFAYMAQAQSVKYSMVQRDVSSGKESRALVEARYNFVEIPGLPASKMPQIAARRLTQESTWAESEAANATEIVDLFESQATDGESVMLTRWQREDSAWSCQHGDAGMEQALAWPLFTPDVAFIHAIPSGTEVINGRSAYKLKPPENSESIWGTPLFYWIDEDSLLPLAFEYQPENGNILRFVLEEVNGQVDIAPPNTDVACSEGRFGS
jgi:hypothetical protein